ncbi:MULTISPECIES: MdtA/MuxA family multidrug efflux RND transporter periplasmic adaptor subunit [unclassified Serratia (in: enterobacteria)]|uniref:MdtA/MuxA family multidrug efflux RND transporter periplasmic adaptor subunit n=1 Tax=unclassified Serratia (in: enterobacteria) TaxID=2647522 RepID=UPI0018AC4D7B|nr:MULTISPECIES: MdtA/MuxA family multidrug efflux RND transporter periplasmic adaptor subunit [unclassified Serratia (in: enterobacteria)]
MNTKPKRRSLLLRLLAIVIVVLAAILIWRHFSAPQATDAVPGAQQAGSGPAGAAGRTGSRRGVPMSPVQAATATVQSVPRFLSGLGTATAANTVTVTSRVDGQLMAIHFTEGQQVKAGDLLVEIDPRPYEVQLTQALGQLAKDQATLANAKRDLARYQQLAKTNLVSRQELDTQESLVRQTEGAIKADQGAVDSAKLQITYSKITAPIDGRVGLKLVDVGNYIASGSTTGIVVITQTHPIDVVFTLPESNIADLVKAQKAGPVSVEAWDRTNQQLLTTGELLSLDNQIDTATGTIKLKARFDNQDDALFPNQFVNARLKVATLQNAVVIPTAALQMGNEGNFVWLLSADNKVSKHRVTAGIQDSQQVVISAGVNAGDRVVTDGIDRLTEGMQVEVVAPHQAAATTTTEQPKHRAKPQGNS